MSSIKNPELVAQIQRAIEVIQEGSCKRVDVNDSVKVYACGTIIRIDIKQS